MRKLLTVAGAAALLAFSQAAWALDASGEVEEINEVEKTVVIDGTTYQYSTENTQGIAFEDLEPGAAVHIIYEENQDGTADLMEISEQE